MGREIEGFRDQIMLIRERFPDQEMFDTSEVIILLKRSRNFVKKHIMYDRNNICIALLAHRLCELR